MLKTFLDEQTEEQIIKKVFHREIPASTRNLLRTYRLAAREALTEQDATPIQAIINEVAELSREYRLVIVSATSEKLIKNVLKKHDNAAFSYIFGRNSRRVDHEWKEVETKAQLFIRLSSMLGIPLDRMVFVGDSHADYKAATQLSIMFVENTFNADRYGRKTLIKGESGKHPKVSGREQGELRAAINRIEQDLSKQWSKI